MRPEYLRDGVVCFIDRSRGYLVQATPEEHVRQDALDWLLDDLKLPVKLVRSEFSISKRGGTGRADIVVHAPGSTDSDGKSVLVVECKRDGAFLDDAVRDQATSYAKSVNASYVVVTNGKERVAFAKCKGRWRKLRAVPSWREMLKEQGLRWEPEPTFARPAWNAIDTASKCRALCKHEPFEWIVGEDTPDYVLPIALNLFGCLAFEREFALPIEDDAIVIEKDLGIRSRWFGNAAGGGWPSEFYRSFLVREKACGSHQVVSVNVLAGAKRSGDPTFGNVRGQTYLIVAVDDGTASHNSLQLPLDKFISEGQALMGSATLRHDGTMTSGKSGRVTNEKVLAFVRRNAPHLLDHDRRVLLGTIPTNRLITWPDARELLLRLVRYALVRDAVRRDVRAQTPATPPAPTWEYGDIVKALYDGELHEPARFIRLKSKTWAWLHWYDDTYSPVRLKDIVGRSARPWKLAEVDEDVDLSDLEFV